MKGSSQACPPTLNTTNMTTETHILVLGDYSPMSVKEKKEAGLSDVT